MYLVNRKQAGLLLIRKVKPSHCLPMEKFSSSPADPFSKSQCFDFCYFNDNIFQLRVSLHWRLSKSGDGDISQVTSEDAPGHPLPAPLPGQEHRVPSRTNSETLVPAGAHRADAHVQGGSRGQELADKSPGRCFRRSGARATQLAGTNLSAALSGTRAEPRSTAITQPGFHQVTSQTIPFLFFYTVNV